MPILPVVQEWKCLRAEIQVGFFSSENSVNFMLGFALGEVQI